VNAVLRNVLVFSVVTLTWIFFFVPNSVFSFLNVQQLQTRLPNLALFVLVPLALSAVCMFAAAGTLSTRMILSVCVPPIGATTCLALWLSGIYSDEALLGAWMYSLPPIFAYIVGLVVAALLLRRGKRSPDGARTATSD
jgi:ABC-type proline/glycine betaine transport system permease subunit